MNDNLTYLLCTTSRFVVREIDTSLKNIGISSHQVMMLDVINKTTGQHLTPVSIALKMDRSTFTRNVSLLTANGWVMNNVVLDARCKTYFLTAEGLRLLEASKAVIKIAEDELRNNVGADLFDSVASILNTFSKRLA